MEYITTINSYPLISILASGSSKERLTISGLNAKVYETICKELNKPIDDKDYKALAGHMGYTAGELKKFQLKRDPADALLSHWATKSDNDVNKLIEILKKMERDDLIKILEARGTFHVFKLINKYSKIGLHKLGHVNHYCR